jgi:hypothetical protein
MASCRTIARACALVLVPAALAACGGVQRVQLYEGAPLPEDQVTVLFSNPRLQIEVDRQYKLPVAENARLHRIELPPGNHAVEVRCLYQDDKGTVSPVIALALEGEAAHRYKPRVQFGRSDSGQPTCKARMFDVTGDPAGQKLDGY